MCFLFLFFDFMHSRYVLKIKKKQKDMVAAEKAVQEEKEEQAKGDDEL